MKLFELLIVWDGNKIKIYFKLVVVVIKMCLKNGPELNIGCGTTLKKAEKLKIFV